MTGWRGIGVAGTMHSAKLYILAQIAAVPKYDGFNSLQSSAPASTCPATFPAIHCVALSSLISNGGF